MAPELFKVSVPGSLMLMGEHAVLYGKQAIVCAVDQRLEITLTPNATHTITITDTRLGTLTQNLNNLHVQDPFKFVLQAIICHPGIRAANTRDLGGFTLDINSEFSSVIGFGSSAAVTVATVAVLSKWLDAVPLSQEQIFNTAKKIMLELQGVGSGADIAASVYGGVLGYLICDPNKSAVASHFSEIACYPRKSVAFIGDLNYGTIIPLQIIPNLTVIYSGYKTPTPEVIAIVRDAHKRQPNEFAEIFHAMHDCALKAITAIQQANWPLLGALFTRHHGLQAAIGTSNQLLDELVQLLIGQRQIYGAKISGAGLGDCVIGLGEILQPIVPPKDGMWQFPIQISQQGIVYDN